MAAHDHTQPARTRLGARFKHRLPLAQLVKYGIIGLLSNACGYALYLLLTELGAPPKLVMTLLYLTGALIGFFGNRRLTFSYQGGFLGSGFRYILAHTLGYGINLALLTVFVDHFGYAHQWVQAMAILVVAGYLFLTLKFFVFKASQ